MEKMSLTEKEQERQLIEGLIYADRFINRQYLSNIDVHAVQRREENYAQMRLFRLSKLVFDVNENTNDKLISVYGALNSIGATVMIVIRSTASGVEFYVGTRCTQSSTAGSILEQALRGNFAGSEITPLRNAEISRTMHEAILSRENGTAKNVSTVTLVPSMRDQEKENYVQGIEKLIDSMAGRAYTAVLIAEPLGQKMIEEKKRGFEELYATLSPLSETTLAYGKNASYAVANGTFSSFSESINNSVTNSNSETQSETTTTGTSDSTNFGSSSDGSSFGFGSSSSYSQSYGTSTSWSRAVTSGETKTDSSGVNQTITNTIGENRTLTVKHVNKSVTDLMEHIDRQLERIRECESFGLWSTSAYFVSEDIQTSVIGASTLRALLAGDDTQIDRAFINPWDSANSQTVSQVLTSIASGMHPVVHLPRANQYDEQNVKPTVLVSGKELPLFMGLPQRSVPGLVVDHMASFGRAVFNPQARPDAETLELGVVLHKGIRQNVPVSLELEEFRSHCFITGSTGSGKSNTSYHLLECFAQRQIPFLVVEPAKGEYKFAFGNLPGVNIFWTNPSQYGLLRLNPFSFPDGIHILEHMDRLIEIFNACWPLYSAMPAILKAAVERAYVSCGWDLVRSRRCPVGDRVFPTFADLLRELPRVISESSYSKDTKGDYTGALVTRVSSMTNGIMGSIFCSDYEIEDMVLFDQNTIVDLSRVGASETKALIMGVLVMKLNEYRMSRSHGMNLRLVMVVTILYAYPLSRGEFRFGQVAMALCVFTMYFGGGLIPTYLWEKQLGLLNTMWSFLLPATLNVHNMIVMRTYFATQIPTEIRESTEIDGCGEWRYLTQFVLPLSGSVLAVIALYYAVARWNSYFDAMIYLTDKAKLPLQNILREILIVNSVSNDVSDAAAEAAAQTRAELLKYAVIVVATLPMMLVYPFVQKFFVQGVMLGSVKG